MTYSSKLNNNSSIIDRVAEINLIKRIIIEEHGSIKNAMHAAANEKYGTLESQVHLLLIFEPACTILSRTNDWTVCAFLNY